VILSFFRYWLIRIFRLARKLRNYFTVGLLRVKGCSVDWTAEIHSSAVIERNDGYVRIGARTIIDRGVVIRAMGGSVIIGSHSSVNAYSFLSGGGNLEIKDNVMIASHVSIYASNHIFIDTQTPMNRQGLSQEGIFIDSDVWIGTGVRVLDGVSVGKGSILCAGAVVTKFVPPYSVVGGVPACLIRCRNV
jgi:acetyltransferase-like isoleucine patch superfamily enzyme